MIVFVVENGTRYEGGSVIGIFMSKERAEKMAEEQRNSPGFASWCDYCTVSEYDVDESE